MGPRSGPRYPVGMRAVLMFTLALALGLGLASCKPKKAAGTGGKTTAVSAREAGDMKTLDYLSDHPVRKFDKPEVVTDPKKCDYYAELDTTKGKILIDLLKDSAPVTVNSFVFLALNHFYDGVRWHRVVPGFVAQAGDPTGTGAGDAGYSFGLEIDEKLAYDAPGWVGMARTQDPNSNSSQFFITLAPTPHLTGQYTIFGKVVEGMDVVQRLTPEDKINRVRILCKEKK